MVTFLFCCVKCMEAYSWSKTIDSIPCMFIVAVVGIVIVKSIFIIKLPDIILASKMNCNANACTPKEGADKEKKLQDKVRDIEEDFQRLKKQFSIQEQIFEERKKLWEKYREFLERLSRNR